MSIVTGNVKASSQTKFGYGILVNDKWYNSKYEIKASKGDEVEFDDGGKNYIKGLKVVGSSPVAAAPSVKASGGFSRGTFPIPAKDGQRSIIRQNSVTNAVNLYTAIMATAKFDVGNAVSDVLLMAREFEQYSSGDLDAEIEAEIDEQFEVK